MISLRFSFVVLWVALVVALSCEVVYQGVTIDTQQQTIRQLMGFTNGPDATPLPLPMPKTVVPAPNGPEPQERSTFDQRRLLKTI